MGAVLSLIFGPDESQQQNVPVDSSTRKFGPFKNHWRGILGTLVPIFFIPLGLSLKRSDLCMMIWAIVSVMSFLQPVPIPVTATIPVFMFPMLGVLDSNTTCKCYLNSVTAVMVTGSMLLLLFSFSKLDKRIACSLMKMFGPSHPMLLLSICLASGLLSVITMRMMVVATMLPLVDELLKKLHSVGQEAPYQMVGSKKFANPVAAIYFIAVGSSAAIGSIGIPIASMASFTFLAQIDTQYPMIGEEFSFMRLTIFTLPVTIIMLLLNYLYLLISIKADQLKISPASTEVIKLYLKNQCECLGPMTYHQMLSISSISSMVLALLTRAPMLGGPGWAGLINTTPKYVRDSVMTASMAVVLHSTPADTEIRKYLKHKKKNQLPPVAQRPNVLSWGYTNKNIPWSYLFIIGSAVALVEGTRHSELDEEFAAMLSSMNGLPYGVTIVIIVFLAIFLTNVMHYVAVLGFLMPVAFQMAKALNICPLIPPLAVGLACSLTFTIPFCRTPPSLVNSVGLVDQITLVKHGVASATICAVVLCISFIIPAHYFWPCEDVADIWACGQISA